MTFDPKKHIIKVQGNREYLPIAARILWMRLEHPDWSIITKPAAPLMDTVPNGYAIYYAEIRNAEGYLLATGTKMEDRKGFPDFTEKAETGAVGRALAMAGYGTQFTDEFDTGNLQSAATKPQQTRPETFQEAAKNNRPAAPARVPVEQDAPVEEDSEMGGNPESEDERPVTQSNTYVAKAGAPSTQSDLDDFKKYRAFVGEKIKTDNSKPNKYGGNARILYLDAAYRRRGKVANWQDEWAITCELLGWNVEDKPRMPTKEQFEWMKDHLIAEGGSSE